MKRAPDAAAGLDRDVHDRARLGQRHRLPDRPGPRVAALGHQPRLHRPEPVVRALRRRGPARLPALRPGSRARSATFDRVREAALLVRDALDALGMPSLREDHGLARHPRLRADRARARRRRRSGRSRRRSRRRSASATPTLSPRSTGSRSARTAACSSTTTRTRGAARSRRVYSVRPKPRRDGVDAGDVGGGRGRASRSRTSASTTCRARVGRSRRPVAAAARAGRFDWARVDLKPDVRPCLKSRPVPPRRTSSRCRPCAHGARSVERAADGPELAVRAQVGRLPLPRVPRRRRGRAAVEGAASRSRATSRRSSRPAGAEGASSSCWTARSSSPSDGASLVRPPAAAHPSGREPRQASWRRRRRRCSSCSICWWTTAATSLVDTPLARAAGGLEAFAAKHFEGQPRVRALARDDRPSRRPSSGSTELAGGLDGVDREARSTWPYQSRRARRHGEDQAHRTADCVVGGFRYAQQGQGRSARCCSASTTMTACCTTSGFSSSFKPASGRTCVAEAREARTWASPGSPGTRPAGRAGGATERSTEWQPLRPELVVEVEYDHFTGGRFRHGTQLRALAAGQGAEAVHVRAGAFAGRIGGGVRGRMSRSLHRAASLALLLAGLSACDDEPVAPGEIGGSALVRYIEYPFGGRDSRQEGTFAYDDSVVVRYDLRGHVFDGNEHTVRHSYYTTHEWQDGRRVFTAVHVRSPDGLRARPRVRRRVRRRGAHDARRDHRTDLRVLQPDPRDRPPGLPVRRGGAPHRGGPRRRRALAHRVRRERRRRRRDAHQRGQRRHPVRPQLRRRQEPVPRACWATGSCWCGAAGRPS